MFVKALLGRVFGEFGAPPVLDEAGPLLDEALDLSMAARSTPFVALCLAGHAQQAFADGDPDRLPAMASGGYEVASSTGRSDANMCRGQVCGPGAWS